MANGKTGRNGVQAAGSFPAGSVFLIAAMMCSLLATTVDANWHHVDMEAMRNSAEAMAIPAGDDPATAAAIDDSVAEFAEWRIRSGHPMKRAAVEALRAQVRAAALATGLREGTLRDPAAAAAALGRTKPVREATLDDLRVFVTRNFWLSEVGNPPNPVGFVWFHFLTPTSVYNVGPFTQALSVHAVGPSQIEPLFLGLGFNRSTPGGAGFFVANVSILNLYRVDDGVFATQTFVNKTLVGIQPPPIQDSTRRMQYQSFITFRPVSGPPPNIVIDVILETINTLSTTGWLRLCSPPPPIPSICVDCPLNPVPCPP